MGLFPDEPISPELVLVDPVLRERLLRASLQELLHERAVALRPPPRETLSPARTDPVVAAAPASPAAPARTVPARGRARRHLPVAISVMALATLFVALPSLAFLPPRQAPRIDTTEPPSSAIAGPQATWQADPAADYYRLEVVGDGRLMHVAYPSSPPVPLGFLPPGDYAWRVFAGHGDPDDHDTRGPIAGGTFVVPKDAEGLG